MVKKIILGLILALTIAPIMAVPVLAAKGASKGQDVTWMVGSNTYKAIFHTTGSGIIHQWRYEPNTLHTIYMPVAKFPKMPKGDGWGRGTWAGITGNGIPALVDIFGSDTSATWWWKVN